MSDKSIAQKLFIKPGNKFLLVNPPAGYIAQMGQLPEGTILMSDSSCLVEVIQVFVTNRLELETQLPKLKEWLAPKGMIWVTYHKGTSKMKTDINRDTINAYAGSLGLQGVAMISIDDDWSALRLKLIQE
jgi:agmatine/peptidylarginine deiminase